MLVCEQEELEYWETRERQLNDFSKTMDTVSLPIDIERDIKRRIRIEMEICVEQENQLLHSDE